jgi:hypothetical protein
MDSQKAPPLRSLLMRPLCLVLAFSAIAVFTGARTGRLPDSGGECIEPVAAYGRLPLSFEANIGQKDSRVRFSAHSRGAALLFTQNEALLHLGGPQRAEVLSDPPGELKSPPAATLAVQFLGANAASEITGEERLAGVSNYLIGDDPNQWRTNVPNYARVRRKDVYPGVDVVYYGNQGSVEYDLEVAPGADPSVILERFTGASDQRIDLETGDLVLEVAGREVRQKRPVAYQQFDGHRSPVEAEWALDSSFAETGANSTAASFRLGDYDRSRPLVIDPVLTYSTYLGGGGYDQGSGIAVDEAGSAYVTGWTQSTDFPLQSPFQDPGDAGTNAFVTKLSPAGNALVYSTYLGGGADDYGQGIKVDAIGSAYIAGTTGSTNFPTVNPYQTDPADGNFDAFLAKLSPSGDSLVYSTYLGGSAYEKGNALAIDDAGNAYVTGETTSINFPTVNPYQGAPAVSTGDVFVTKFSAAGDTLIYSSYLRGSENEYGYGIAVDDAGSAYITGLTGSTDFPTANDFQPDQPGIDIYITKFSPLGNSLVYSTYLGGSGDDRGFSIAVDADDCAYVTGRTSSTDFPMMNSYQTKLRNIDVFVSKLARNGRNLVYSTYIGDGDGKGIAVDEEGNAYITGFTGSSRFPADNYYQAGSEAFATKISLPGNTLAYSTYLGGNAWDSGYGIAVSPEGTAYVTGGTDSSNFAVVNPYQTNLPNTDGFITRLDPYSAPSGLVSTPAPRAMLLTWTDNAARERGFEIQRKVLGGVFVTAGFTEADAASFFEGSLSPEMQYDYRVRAYGPEGHSSWSDAISAVTLPEPPNAPTGLYATASAANTLTLRWTDNANNENGFLLQRSTNRTTWTQILDGTSNTILFNDTGLNAGATYYYRVCAYNGSGASSWSEIATGVVRAALPAAPTQLKAVPLSSSQMLLTWKDNAFNELFFRIEAKQGTNSFAEIGTAGVSVTTFAHVALAPNATWTYRVRAYSDIGNSAYSNEFTATTLPNPPAAPDNLVVTPLSNQVVSLAWTDNSTNETEFRIERKEGAAPYAQIALVVANGTTYFDSAVAPSTTYTYRMRAANAGGVSGYSSPAGGTTLASVSKGVLEVRPGEIRFSGVAPGATTRHKLTIRNAGKGPLRVVVARLAAPFAVEGPVSFALKPKEKRVLKVRYTASVDANASSTSLGVAGSGRTNPVVYVPVSVD